MTVRDLYHLLEDVLKFHNYVMARRGNTAIIAKADAASVELLDSHIVGVDGEPVIQVGDVIVKRVFQLKHIDTASAKNLLAGAKLGLNITEIAGTRTLLVTGYGYRMQRVKQLLDLIDKPGKAKLFRFRKLEFTTAEILVPKVQSLVQQLGEISIEIGQPPTLPTKAKSARERILESRTRTKSKNPTVPPRGSGASAPTTKAQDVGVYLDFDERTNRILMIGFEEDLKTVNELIDTLDVQKQDLRKIRVYEIQNVDAEEVRTKLQELGMISASQTSQTSRGRSGRISGPGSRTPPRTSGTTGAAKGAPPSRSNLPTQTSANEGPLVEEPQVVIIESTNSLLVNATEEQHLQITMIIGYVDSETQLQTIPYVVYPLENQDPEELEITLNKLIQETTSQQDKEGKTISSVTRKRTEDEIVIIADKNTFSLIVYATKYNQSWISQLIEKLDKRRPQVLIDVTLVQVTKDDAFSFDLELLSSIPDMGFTSGQIAGVDSTIFDMLVNTPERDEFIDMKSSDGRFTGFYGDRKINALLTAMETKEYGRVMARPKLLVNDNETGSIMTTDTTFIERRSSNTISGGAGEPVISEQVSFDDYSAGITMEITPHISEGDMLRLEITLNRSGFTSPITESITKPPNKADADVTTVVTVPDKSTIILGGLEKVSNSKGGTKIPFLGDLPFIGPAFRTVERSEGHDKLYIFVKAHIARPGGEDGLSDLKSVSQSNRATFEVLEKEMGEYQDWPGIKSAPMDPVRVLEVD
jgi:type II secretory pathway component GspD/PulD (secretin)